MINRQIVEWRYDTEAPGGENAFYRLQGQTTWREWEGEREPPRDVMEHFHGKRRGEAIRAYTLMKFEDDWILFVEPFNFLAMLHEAALTAYTNVSHPNSDELTHDMIIEIPEHVAEKLIGTDIFGLAHQGIFAYDSSHWLPEGVNYGVHAFSGERPANW